MNSEPPLSPYTYAPKSQSLSRTTVRGTSVISARDYRNTSTNKLIILIAPRIPPGREQSFGQTDIQRNLEDQFQRQNSELFANGAAKIPYFVGF